MELLKENNDGNRETLESHKTVEDFETDFQQANDLHGDDKDAFRHRFLHTSCVFLSLLALGWRNSMLGPTFPDLRLIIDQDLSSASWIFTAKSLGGLVGSLFGGFAYDRFNKTGLLAILTTCVGLFAGIVPWCSSLAAMFVIHAAHGLCAIGLDTAATADVVLVWRNKAGPYMQALHGAFSIGTIVSPLICEPFLARNTYNEEWNSTVMIDSANHYYGIQETNKSILSTINDTNSHSNVGETNMHIPYLITMGVCLLVSLSFVFPGLIYGDVYKKSVVIEVQADMSGSARKYFLSHRMKVSFTILLAVTIAIYTISEYCFAGFLMTFLITELKWSKTSGSNATSIFWIAFAVGRLTGIFVVKCARLWTVLVVFFILCILGTILFWVSVSHDIEMLTWISIAVVGYGMSVLFPTIFSWLSENVRSLTGKTCSILFVAISVGTMTVPRLVGYLMDKHSQLWFIYIMMVLSVAMLFVFIVILVLFKLLERRTLHEKHCKKMSL